MLAPIKLPLLSCWICGGSCCLEDCKTDERGLAVHEDCYVAMLLRKKITVLLPLPVPRARRA